MKKLGMIMEIVIIVLLLPFAFDGFKSARAIEYTQTIPAVTTAATTTANVTLLKPLFDDDSVNVSVVVSGNNTDVPAVSTYTAETKALAITGLVENTTRTLYLTYIYPRFTGGVDTVFSYLPMLMVFGLVIHIVMKLFSGRR